MPSPLSHLIITLYCAHVLSLTTVIEMVEILDGRVGKCSVERVRYVINNLLHLVIVKYEVISLIVYICTHLWLVKIQTLLVKVLVIFQLTRVISHMFKARYRGNTDR